VLLARSYKSSFEKQQKPSQGNADRGEQNVERDVGCKLQPC
jgi:hypothetical protein